MTFKELNIAEPILRAICEKGYTEATPIQEKGIPAALSGRDMFGIAQTGTGKTAAFAIPIIQKLWEERLRQRREQKSAAKEQEQAQETVAGEINPVVSEGENPASDNQKAPSRKDRRGRNHGRSQDKRRIKGLILTPTRELAIQISECFNEYAKYTGLKHCMIFGGVKQKPQTEKLNKGVDVLIATPGRLHDLINQGFVNLKHIEYFVLDEADRMLDMGFIADIKRLLPMLPSNRQTLFFSATMPQSIVSLSRSMLTNPQRVEVTPVSSTVDTIEQRIYFVEKPEKKKLLLDVLHSESDKSVLVFSRTKHGADNISRILKKAGIQSEAIHGDKSQGQRQRALSNFKEGKVKVMVATDIAARGIDIDQLGMVINYDLPDVPETYIHRIGRTGRAGNSGTALTFCSQDDHMMIKDIQELTGKKLEMILVS